MDHDTVIEVITENQHKSCLKIIKTKLSSVFLSIQKKLTDIAHSVWHLITNPGYYILNTIEWMMERPVSWVIFVFTQTLILRIYYEISYEMITILLCPTVMCCY